MEPLDKGLLNIDLKPYIKHRKYESIMASLI